MISRPAFIDKLRELGYSFKGRTKSLKNELYRKKGETHVVFVPRIDILSDSYVITALVSCGVSQDEARIFLREKSKEEPG